MSNDILRTELAKGINSLSLERDELKKIIETLQVKANEACKLEIGFIQTLTDLKGDIEVMKQNLSKCSLLKVTIKGSKGENLFGSVVEVFDTNIFPDKVQSVYVNSEIPYVAQFNYRPRNLFQLFIDFSKPKIFDFSIQPSEKTPNNSHFKVEGYDATWVNGVFSELDRFFLNKRIKFIHRASAYDIIVWLIGIPFAFWCCFKLSPFINNFSIKNTFLISALFVYLFIASLLAIRMLFHYFRWVYPMVAFRNKNDKSILHQGILYAITVGMFGKFLYDIGKWIFSF